MKCAVCLIRSLHFGLKMAEPFAVLKLAQPFAHGLIEILVKLGESEGEEEG